MIKGKRITLRAIDPNDLPRYVTWLNDPEVTRHLKTLPPFNLDNETDWYERQRNDQSDLNLAIVLNESQEHIGSVSLMQINQRDQNAELGIVIGDKTKWGQGYGQEAITLLLKYSFLQLNLHRIYLRVDASHSAGIRCYTNCGFKEEGRMRHSTYHHGQFEDQLMMSVLRPEYLRGESN
jgi:diamine N-acetyltransferase